MQKYFAAVLLALGCGGGVDAVAACRAKCPDVAALAMSDAHCDPNAQLVGAGCVQRSADFVECLITISCSADRKLVVPHICLPVSR